MNISSSSDYALSGLQFIFDNDNHRPLAGEGDCPAASVNMGLFRQGESFSKLADRFQPSSYSTPRHSLDPQKSSSSPTMSTVQLNTSDASNTTISSLKFKPSKIFDTTSSLVSTSSEAQADSSAEISSGTDIQHYESLQFQSMADISGYQSQVQLLTAENSSLKLQLETTSLRLKRTQQTLKALLDLEPTTEPETEATLDGETSTSTSSVMRKDILNANALVHSSTSSCEIKKTTVATTCDKDLLILNPTSSLPSRIPGMLPEGTLVLIQEITSRMEVYNVRERVLEGLQYTNQFALGTAAGYGSAYFLQNFGKTIFTALAGGAILFTCATKQGFVEVNWNRIFNELQKRSNQLNRVSSREDASINIDNTEDEEDWGIQRIRIIKEWITDNHIAVGGFAIGFLYPFV